jgi:hypothetical protein
VSLCLVVSRGAVGIIQLDKLTFAVASFDQQLSLLLHALYSAKNVEQLVVAFARKVAVGTRKGLALFVTVLSL